MVFLDIVDDLFLDLHYFVAALLSMPATCHDVHLLLIGLLFEINIGFTIYWQLHILEVACQFLFFDPLCFFSLLF